MTTRLMSIATLPASEVVTLGESEVVTPPQREDVALPEPEDVALPEPEVGTPTPESDVVTPSEPETALNPLDFFFEQWMRFMTAPLAAMAAFEATAPGKMLDRMTRVDELL